MPLSNVDLTVHFAAGTTQSISGVTHQLRIVDGRNVSSWYDSPGVIEVLLHVCNHEVVEQDKFKYYGQLLELTVDAVVYWAGRISAMHFKADEQGVCVRVAITAFSVDDLLSRGEQLLQYTSLSLSAVQHTIPIGLVASDAQGITVTDEWILVVDASDDKVYGWSAESRNRATGPDFDLVGPHDDATGISSDGMDRVFVTDSVDDTVREYVQPRGYQEDPALSYTVDIPSASMAGSFELVSLSATVASIVVSAQYRNVSDVRVDATYRDGSSIEWASAYFQAFGGTFLGRQGQGELRLFSYDVAVPRMLLVRIGFNISVFNFYRISNVLLGSALPSTHTGSVVDYIVEGSGSLVYALSSADSKLYGLSKSLTNDNTLTWTRVASIDIDLVADNSDPKFVVWDETYLRVWDATAGLFFTYDPETLAEVRVERFSPGFSDAIVDAKYWNGVIYALVNPNIVRVLTSSADTPVHSSVNDIDTNSAYTLSGCVYVNETLYVSYSDYRVIEAYQDRQHVVALDIDPGAMSGIVGFNGLATDDIHVLGVTTSGAVRGYNIATRQHNEHYDVFISAEATLSGVAFRGSHLYIVYSGAAGRIEIREALREENVVRPRERASNRYSFLYEQVTGSAGVARMGSRELPANNVSGRVRDGFRRVADAEPGRIIDGQFYPYGSWRVNVADESRIGMAIAESPLALAAEQYVRTPREQDVESLLVNQLTMSAYDGSVVSANNDASIDVYGRKERSVNTDASRSGAEAVAAWIVDVWGTAYKVLTVEINALYELDSVSSGMLGASPHTCVFVDAVTQAPWLVLRREVQLVAAAAVVDASIVLSLVSPRQFGVGWVLDGSNELIADRLDQDTILIEPEY